MTVLAIHPRPTHHIADIVRLHRKALEAKHVLTLDQRRLVGSIVVCRTPALTLDTRQRTALAGGRVSVPVPVLRRGASRLAFLPETRVS